MIFVTIIRTGVFDFTDFHIEVLMELIIKSVVVLLGKENRCSQPLVRDSSETPHSRLEHKNFRFRAAIECNTKQGATVPAFFTFFDQNDKLFFVALTSRNIQIIEISNLKEHYPDLFNRAATLEENAMPYLKTVKGLGRSYSWKEQFGKE